nr:hypothetical protein [Mycobacterium haemophilum]
MGRPDGRRNASQPPTELPHEVLDAVEITARFPNFRPQPADIALYEAKVGFARLGLAVRAQL